MKKTLLLLTCLTLVSCATERYGRLIKVTEYEKKNLTCRELNIEEAKAQQFMDDLLTEVRKLGFTDMLAFFGDLGVGNIMEVRAAEKSGQARLDEIKALKIENNCK